MRPTTPPDRSGSPDEAHTDPFWSRQFPRGARASGRALPGLPCDLGNSPRADERGRVPGLAHAGDLHHVARVWRVDELSVADVDPHVSQPVEEDEIAGLELVDRDRDAVVVLGGRVVG